MPHFVGNDKVQYAGVLLSLSSLQDRILEGCHAYPFEQCSLDV